MVQQMISMNMNINQRITMRPKLRTRAIVGCSFFRLIMKLHPTYNYRLHYILPANINFDIVPYHYKGEALGIFAYLKMRMFPWENQAACVRSLAI